MDGTAAIKFNLVALKRILAGLVSMAGFGPSAIGGRQPGLRAADGTTPPDCLLPAADCRLLLPRHLRLAILRLLRPAESAARRLIIASARGLVVSCRRREKPRRSRRPPNPFCAVSASPSWCLRPILRTAPRSSLVRGG